MSKRNFEGVWKIVALENRYHGEWKNETDFGPNEWMVGFSGDGKWSETFRSENKRQSGRWVYDLRTGVLLTACDESPASLQSNAFDGDETGGWFYLCEYALDVPLDHANIIARHACQRHRMVRA
jgi:hypothetical protein